MNSHYTDSHAHLTSDELWPDVEALLQRAQRAGVNQIINICTDIPTLERGLELHARYPWVYNTAATTPHDVEKEGELVFPIIAEQARRGTLVAVGETGLDYYYQHSCRKLQQQFLVRYLHLALECRLPVVIHCREAFSDFFSILDQEYKIGSQHAPGVLHCFTGSVAEAEEVFKRGWYLSLSGIVTFKKSETLREVARMAPLSQLLIETDAPYLAPQSKRGQRNEPAHVVEVAECVAAVKQLSVAEVRSVTSENAQRLFRLD